MRSSLLYTALITTLGGTVYCMSPVSPAEESNRGVAGAEGVTTREEPWRPTELPQATWLGLDGAGEHAAHASADCRSCHRGDLRVSAPTRLASGAAASAGDAEWALTPGMTRDAVRASLGEPASIEGDGARWAYAERTVLFRDDVVRGWVQADAKALAANQHAAASTPSREPQFAGRFASMGPAPQAAARRSSSDSERRFDVLTRLRASRSTVTTTFRQPQWLRSLARSLDRNHDENRRREQRLTDGRRG